MVAAARQPGAQGPEARPADLGAVVLCGGLSRRMGRPKAWLPFGTEWLLQRVVRVLVETAAPIVVVAAPDQSLPDLPAGVELAHDPVPGRGPLQGIAVGLAALAQRTRLAFVSSADLPLLQAAFVRRVYALCGSEHDVAVPCIDGHRQPLAAVYATSLAEQAGALIASGERCPLALLERARTLIVGADDLLADVQLRRVDPDLASLRNVNTPAEYAAVLREAEAMGEEQGPRCYNHLARKREETR